MFYFLFRTKLTAQQLRMGDNDQGYHTLMSSSVITTHINPSYGNWSRTETITCGLRLEALNTSVLLQIFQWLDQSDLCNLALTCKRFSLVAWSPYLWKTIHIKGDYTAIIICFIVNFILNLL